MSSRSSLRARVPLVQTAANGVRFPGRSLGRPRRMSGRERRWLNPSRGIVKLIERTVDRLASRYVYPHLLGVWSPYSWQLPRRLVIAQGSNIPPGSDRPVWDERL